VNRTVPPATEKVEYTIGTLLRAGVTLSATVVIAGGVWYLSENWKAAPHYGNFRGEPEGLHSISGIVAGAFSGSARHLIQFGLLLLIAMPVARVAFSVVAFARERDSTYVMITLVVLAILLYSLLH
jgi:uncharacterized membrane protein